MALTADNVLRGHSSEETAYVVDDYPYGYRLRTQIRYWIETTKHGDRFCAQTLNPKTDRWNKPKKSTYVAIGAMYLDDVDHVRGDGRHGHSSVVQWTGISTYTTREARDAFLAVMGEDLSASQRDRLAEILGTERAYEGVTFTVREGTQTAEEREEQARIEHVLRHRVARETGKAREELD